MTGRKKIGVAFLATETWKVYNKHNFSFLRDVNERAAHFFQRVYHTRFKHLLRPKIRLCCNQKFSKFKASCQERRWPTSNCTNSQKPQLS